MAGSGRKRMQSGVGSVCPWRAETQVSDFVCRAPWRQLGLPGLPVPALDLSPIRPWDVWYYVRRSLGLPSSGCLMPGKLWKYRVPSLQWLQGISSWGGRAQHNLQPDLLTWRSGAAPPTASSFLLKAVLARDWGQRNLGHWGYWSPGDSSYLISYSVTLLQNPFYNPCCTLLYPLLPCLSTWVLTSAMLEYLARLSSKKKKVHMYLYVSLLYTCSWYKECVAYILQIIIICNTHLWTPYTFNFSAAIPCKIHCQFL